MNFGELINAIAELDNQKVLIILESYPEEAISARDIVAKGISPGLLIVGERYEKGEYFLSELIFAAEIMKDAK